MKGIVSEGDVIQGPWKNPVATQKTNAAELASEFLSSKYAPNDLENEDIEDVAEYIVEFLLKYHEELTDNMDIDDIDTLAKRISREAFVQADLLDEALEENLNKWFKEKWVRFGPDGKIRGACARGSDSEGKPKCLPQSKAHSLGKKGRKYAASKKRREDPNPERTGKAKNVATKKKTNEEQLDELKCWSGYTRVKGVPAGAPGSCKKKTNEEASEKCPHCGGELVSEEMINEKQDACYRKVKSRYKVWPSAYASGALVQCRKKGASNWGTGGKKTESHIMKGIVGETTPRQHLRVDPKTLDTLYQVRAYDRKVSDLNKAKAAEKAKARAAQYKGRYDYPKIQMGAVDFPESLVIDWIENNNINPCVDHLIKKFAGKNQSNEFISELKADTEFQTAVVDFLGVAANNLDYKKNLQGKSPGRDKKKSEAERLAPFDAVNNVKNIIIGHMRKYGVGKGGRRVPPNFKYNLEEALRPEQRALALKKIANDIVDYIGDDPSNSAMADAAAYEAVRSNGDFDPDDIFELLWKHFREPTLEASSPAQQAAIAINMKKKGQKPKNDVQEDYTGMYAAEKTPKINPYGGRPDRQFRGAISEMPNTSGPIGTQPGGWRTYKAKPAGEIEEDTAYGGGMGQGGNAGQSYRKFTPKMAGVVKKESSIMKGLRKEGR